MFFLFKITCLLLAILFHYTIHRKVVMANSSAALRILVAVMSLSLWVAVVFGGIFIEFVKPGLGFDYHAAPAGDLAAKHRAVPVYPRIGSRLRDPAGAARIGDPGICGYRVLTDLRLLNWALRGHSIESVVNQMRVPKRCAHGKRDRRRPA